ncbi:hypothetical protein [Shinella kummerowiae]|uniref:hypothetical protein n=1 Tax=Shinella kummerowiae TaxID=417745 RepID=UPI0021B574E3|nr:hypothetical protein [Shinella kummerowiae]MCT7667416.1 hypothetical protein [Shinella kummerowiae]
MPILFCNIAWMKNYAGRDPDDPPKGGGRYVVSEGIAGEELNFVACDDGYVYGHFETIKDELDRQVKIERLGTTSKAEFADAVDVVWTAPIDGNDPRCVVGWYRNARVYRHRQLFNEIYPSAQHAADELGSFRVRARADDATLLPLKARTERLHLRRGSGWSGQTSWWYAEDTEDPDARAFVKAVRQLMRGGEPEFAQRPAASRAKHRAGQAASQAHTRYLERHEVQVSPRHSELENRFKKFLRRNLRDVQFPPTFRDDLRFVGADGRAVMVEVKPTEPSTVRFAIRIAIGQLLDYRQHQGWTGDQLIVVETEVVNADDKGLAHENGFGLAWPLDKDNFHVMWPDGSTGLARRPRRRQDG